MLLTPRDVERAQREAREAQAEAERVRYELDELKRQQEREADERVERRREERRAAMPSNRLYRGEVTNAREAIQLYINALRYEASRDWAPEPDDSDAPDYLKGESLWPKWIEEGEKHLREYEETVGAAERALAEKWAKADDGSITKVIGEAMLSGDYSGLAI